MYVTTKPFPVVTKNLDEMAILQVGRYRDGAEAWRLVSTGGESLMVVTTCLIEYGYTPAEGYICVKDYSENAGILVSLVQTGLIYMSEEYFSGPYDAGWHICKINLEHELWVNR